MKKYISLLMVLVLIFSAVFCIPVSAATKTDGTFYYELSNSKKYYILVDSVRDIKGSVKIPKAFKGLPVREIAGHAFWDRDNITSVSIYSNIKRIRTSAFGECDKLSKIFLSDYVDRIHATAFYATAYYRDFKNWVGDGLYIGNHFIKADRGISGNYRIKDGTKTIGVGAFEDCEGLKGVVLPDSITAIHDRTFYGCSKLKHIYIPEGVKSIGMEAFSAPLKYIHLPSTLEYISECALPKMSAIYVPEKVSYISLWGIHSDVGMVYGEKGSYVEKIAKKYELPFTPISQHTHNIETVVHSKASVNSCGITYTKCDGCGQIFDYNVTDQKKPSRVVLDKIENGTDGVSLYWSSVKGADIYCVYRKVKGEDNWSFTDYSYGTFYHDRTAKNNKTYVYKVRAVNEAGMGALSKNSQTIKHVSMPEITGLVNNTAGVKITWEKVNYAEKYYLYRFDDVKGKWVRIKLISGNKTFSYVDEDVKSGERYYYKIRAYNDGFLSYDDRNSMAVIQRLSTPNLSSVKSTKSGVKFTWEKVAGAEAYVVYRKTGSSGEWKAIKTIEDGSVVSYLDKTAKKGKTYYYSVRVQNYYYKSAYDKTGLKIKDKY